MELVDNILDFLKEVSLWVDTQEGRLVPIFMVLGYQIGIY
jgi:hypothetical protein